MTIQRWNVIYSYYAPLEEITLHDDEDDKGRFVLWEDVKTLVEELAICRHIIAEMKQAQNHNHLTNECDRP